MRTLEAVAAVILAAVLASPTFASTRSSEPRTTEATVNGNVVRTSRWLDCKGRTRQHVTQWDASLPAHEQELRRGNHDTSLIWPMRRNPEWGSDACWKPRPWTSGDWTNADILYDRDMNILRRAVGVGVR